jgi:hypothetical protein
LSSPEWPGEPEPAASPPAEDRRPDPAILEAAPWEDPERSSLTGYFQTLGEVLRRPAAFFARPARGGPAGPCAFGLITGTAGGLLGLFWWLLLLLASGHSLRSALEGLPRGDFLAGAAGMVAVGMALTPLAVLVKLALGSLCLWAAAVLVGARVGWAPIWRLCCYATAATALALVPWLGTFLVVPLALIILHQGLRGALGMSDGRALGALVVFLVLQILASALLVGGFLALLALLSLLLLG